MKAQRHVTVTILLSVYALFMCIYFGIDLLNSGQYGRFFCIAGAETLVIVLAFFALRKRDRLRQQRKNQ
ncbi:MAG: hypothetical protein K1V90_02275 [Muribaculaceae bacterium]